MAEPGLTIPVSIGDTVVAVLEPMTERTAGDPELVAQLTNWRNAARGAFLTQFEATPERTSAWLEKTVLPDPARRLFIIRDAQGAVGTIGYIHLTAEGAELDNLLRGERRGPPTLVHAVEIALVQWLFATYDLRRIEAVVLSNNFAALQLHHSIGFEIVSRTPLRRVVHENGEIALVDADAPDDSGLHKLRLVLTREGLVL